MVDFEQVPLSAKKKPLDVDTKYALSFCLD